MEISIESSSVILHKLDFYMFSKIENILSLGCIDRERKIPGMAFVKGREYCYVGCGGSENISMLFKTVTRKISPPIAKNGGVINEGCKVKTPTGEIYFAVSYKGDLDGWRKQLEQGAAALGLLTATIKEDKLLVSDGDSVLLSDCQFEFYSN